MKMEATLPVFKDERNNLYYFEYLRQPRAQARSQHGQSVGPKPAHKDSPSSKVGRKNGAIVRAEYCEKEITMKGHEICMV
jgi:hypothetical protein